jgi:hypothetical protein
VTQPASVVFDGNDLVLWADAIADISAPTVAEANAGFNATCYLTGDGWNPAMTEDAVADNRLCARLNFQKAGRKTWALPMMYTINPASPSDDDARTTFVDGAVGYFIERPAVDFEDSVAADDWVQCWAIELGFPQLAGRTANGVWVMSQQAYLRPTGGGTAGLVQVVA